MELSTTKYSFHCNVSIIIMFGTFRMKRTSLMMKKYDAIKLHNAMSMTHNLKFVSMSFQFSELLSISLEKCPWNKKVNLNLLISWKKFLIEIEHSDNINIVRWTQYCFKKYNRWKFCNPSLSEFYDPLNHEAMETLYIWPRFSVINFLIYKEKKSQMHSID